MNNIKVGQFIKEKRVSREITQQELADELFVDVTTVSKWERGVTFPDSGIVSRLCSCLSINEHELFQACEDVELRNAQKRLRKIDNGRNLAFLIISGCYVVAILTCFICNLAVNHTLSWFWIVFSSCVCGWTFVPTCLKFFKRQQLLVFVGTTFLSLAIMFLVISIVTNNYWCFIAMSGTLLGYFVFFFPFIFFKEGFFTKIHKYFTLIYSVMMTILTIVLLVFINAYVSFNIFMSIDITIYCFMPFIICGLIRLIPKINKEIKASIMTFISGSFLVGLNWFLSRYLEPVGNYYKVDFNNWNDYSNGNVCLIFSILTICFVVGLLIIGLIKLKHKNNKIIKN